MLTEFTLANFKSYRKSSLRLGSLTLLIGANASGKSNVLEGLRFLCWLANGHQLNTIQSAINVDRVIRGRVDDLCYRGESSFTIGCRLDIAAWNQLSLTVGVNNGEMNITSEEIADANDPPLYVIDPMAQDQYNPSWPHEINVTFDNFPEGQNSSYVVCDNQMAIFTQLDNPGWVKGSYEPLRQKITETIHQYRKVLPNILFLDAIPAKMRNYSYKSDWHLQEDGVNLSSVLFRLCENQPENKQEILNLIQSIPEQVIDELDFIFGPRGEVMVCLSETFGDTRHNYEAALLSDGTLRVLAIAAAMLSATEGSLIVIEEIDNGVHPSRVKSLITSIQEIAKRRNLQVLICYRDPLVGDSRLVRLGDLDEFPGLISQGSLGQLVTKGVVDRFIKSPHTPEDRKQRSIAWLKRLEEHKNE
jgi:AAA domain, putative AbiEii toxin, Type IV TA system/AAA ATPase domain